MRRVHRWSDGIWASALAISGAALLSVLGLRDPGIRLIQGKKPSTGLMPTTLESPGQVFVGYPGSVTPLSGSSPDFTMAADGYTFITIVYGYPFVCGVQGNFRLDMLSASVDEDGGVAATTDGTRETFVVIPTQQVDSTYEWSAAQP